MNSESMFAGKAYLPLAEDVQAVLSQSEIDLPILPLVVLKLLHITSDEHASLDDLALLVETERQYWQRCCVSSTQRHLVFPPRVECPRGNPSW